jgi:hypothetical protein
MPTSSGSPRVYCIESLLLRFSLCNHAVFGIATAAAPIEYLPKDIGMTDSPGDAEPDVRPAPKRATLRQVAWIVVSGLFMIGRNRDFGPDAPTIGPVRLIIVALIGAALLIAGLVMLATTISH